MWLIPVALPFVQADFGIARADASLPYTLAMTGYALGGVAMGRLCDRSGVVVAIMWDTLALGIGYAGAALVPGPLTFALMHLFIGVGASATFGPLMADMAQWFVRHRGIAVGMAASGNYVGGALWPPVLQHAIATEGWRHTYLGVGVFCVLATLPFMFALRRRAPAQPMVWMPEAASNGPARNLGVSPNALMVLLCVAGVLRGDGDAADPHRRLLRRPRLRAGARRRDAFGDARLRHLEPHRLGSDRGSASVVIPTLVSHGRLY